VFSSACTVMTVMTVMTVIGDQKVKIQRWFLSLNGAPDWFVLSSTSETRQCAHRQTRHHVDGYRVRACDLSLTSFVVS
jgi:hypothetical protein